MATHSSTLTWKIPRMEELGRLQSTGSQRVGHDWATSHIHTHNLKLKTSLHLPTMQETQVRALSWEDPLEREMAIHSSILA